MKCYTKLENIIAILVLCFFIVALAALAVNTSPCDDLLVGGTEAVKACDLR
jgi:hypothetical protein